MILASESGRAGHPSLSKDTPKSWLNHGRRKKTSQNMWWWKFGLYIHIYILRIENNKSWFVNHQYTVCQKYVKHRSHMLGFMEIEGKLTTNCCAQRAKNCRLRLCYSGSIKVAQHICYMSNTSLNVIELPRLWMHVSPASVVKFVCMIFPCLCETPVTSCAKQGTKKNKRNTSKLICYFA